MRLDVFRIERIEVCRDLVEICILWYVDHITNSIVDRKPLSCFRELRESHTLCIRKLFTSLR